MAASAAEACPCVDPPGLLDSSGLRQVSRSHSRRAAAEIRQGYELLTEVLEDGIGLRSGRIGRRGGFHRDSGPPETARLPTAPVEKASWRFLQAASNTSNIGLDGSNPSISAIKQGVACALPFPSIVWEFADRSAPATENECRVV